MPYCSYCGVELDETMNSCPLCGNAASADLSDLTDQMVEYSSTETEDKGFELSKLPPAKKRKLIWELAILILIAGMGVTLLIDKISSEGISWSKYTASISLGLVIHFTLLLYMWNRFVGFMFISFVTNAFLLMLFDSFSFQKGWGIQAGVPLLLLVYLSIMACTLLFRFATEQGINLIAAFFVVAGMLCAGIEIVLDHYLKGQFHMDWSLFVIISIVPIALVLLFVHYRLKKGRELRRLFHI
jgi:hypothetical protein